MQKQVTIIISALAIFLFFLIMPRFQVAHAGVVDCTAGSCTDWCTQSWTCETIDDYGNPIEGWCTSFWCCTDASICGQCDPGEYACNGGCCDIGPTTGPGTDPPDPGGSCTVSGPTITSINPYPPTRAVLNWGLGQNGVIQRVYVGANRAEVESGCPGLASPACVVVQTNLPNTQTQYDTGNVLTQGTLYYYRVQTVESVDCTASDLSVAVSSCYINPASHTMAVTDPDLPLNVSVNTNSEITNVSFVSSPTGVISLNPASDSTYPYGTSAHPEAIGSTQVTATVNSTFGPLCFSQSNISVIPPQSWWQVKDSDVQSNAGISSDVPTGEYFGLSGLGGFPGVPAHTTGTDLTSTNVSDSPSAKWLANSTWRNPRTFNYAYFSNQIPDDITPTPLGPTPTALDLTSGGEFKYGYYWYKYDGLDNSNQDLTLPAINISSAVSDRRVILLVANANLKLNGNITLDDGHGFFMAIVNGNITVDPLVGGGAVPNFEGLYVADGEFQTGEINTQLWVRGSVVGYGGTRGINMQRNLGDALNATDPSELFEYAPDQIMLFPSTLGVRKINWKEIAP